MLCAQAEDVLRENGAIMEEALPMLPKVTVDRELVTGQQPTSAYPVGEKFVEVLQRAHAQGSAVAAQ